MVSDESIRWIEATKILGVNPRALVACPKCSKHNLEVSDIRSESEPTLFERIFYCPECGAKNYMRLHRNRDISKEDFALGNYAYETRVKGIILRIDKDVFNEVTVTYAQKILDLYFSKKHEIIDYILHDSVLDFYEGRYTKNEIVEKLKEADIELIGDKWGKLTWLNHQLDEHIIEVEFNDDMQLSYVSIDG